MDGFDRGERGRRFQGIAETIKQQGVLLFCHRLLSMGEEADCGGYAESV